MKAIVTYYSAQQNLAVILSLLQAQLVPPEEIIVIDTSPTKSGLDICQKFNSNNVPIKVECARVGVYEAWNRGIDIAGKDSDVVIMNDDLIIPINFIDVLSLVAENSQVYCLVPETPEKSHYKDRIDRKFEFYAKLPEEVADIELTNWMPGFCFMLKKECIRDVGIFDDKHYKVWFGDDDYQARILKTAVKNNVFGIIKINSMFVYHFGGKSYQYQSKDVKRLIDRDRKYYVKKYAEKPKAVVEE